MNKNLQVRPLFALFLTCCLTVQTVAEYNLTNPVLEVTNNLESPDKELIVETGQWKVVFSMFFNGGPCRLYDKVYDPNMTDNLWTGPNYSQGSFFDYDIYLLGYQEFMTTVGRNKDAGKAKLEILENTPVRLRLRQQCHPRLNNGKGPPGDPFPELDMVVTTTEWTIYPTGRINIKFDAVITPDWNEVISQGAGGDSKGIDANGTIVTAINDTNFLNPWITHGDFIESSVGKWGPIQISKRINATTLQLASSVPAGQKLDFLIRRNHIIEETFSIHADGDPGPAPRKSRWQGGSNGDPIYKNGTGGDMFRRKNPPVSYDYVYAHWTRPPRGYGSLLALYEPYKEATLAVFNDVTYDDLSYTQVSRHGWRTFEPHHRHFMVQMGTENSAVIPRIKSVADAIPFADDYRHPYARARKGKLQTGEGIKCCGFFIPAGDYRITADDNTAEIAFDTMRGGDVTSPLAYYNPVILISGLNIPDDHISIELSRNNGNTFEMLAKSAYNITTQVQSSQLGSPDRRLFQLLGTIPVTATGTNVWVIRFSEK